MVKTPERLLINHCKILPCLECIVKVICFGDKSKPKNSCDHYNMWIEKRNFLLELLDPRTSIRYFAVIEAQEMEREEKK